MATLKVTTTTDFSADTLTDIDVIDFDSGDPAVTATFTDDPFNDGGIKSTVTIDGSSAFDTIKVNVSSFLTATSWQFSNWTKFDTIIIEGNVFGNNISGSSMADTINGGDGDDRIKGNGGRDLLNGGAGDDELQSFSSDGPDILDGGAGIDTFNGSRLEFAGALVLDIVAGGGGTNIGDGTTVKNVEILLFDSGSGNDTLGGGAFDDALFGEDGNDILTGREGIDELDAGTGDDIIDGGGGDDTIHPGTGKNTVNAGAGNDSIFENSDGSVSKIDGGADIDRLFLDRTQLSIAFTINMTAGGEGADIGDGTTIANVERLDFDGGSGKDRITGGSLEDDLSGGLGSDTLKGGAGVDSLGGGEGNDLLQGGASNDFIRGDEGNDVLEGGKGADDLDGGDGKDALSYAASKAAVEIDLALGLAAGGDAQGDVIANFENVTGSSKGDDLSGNGGTNLLKGGDGNDVLTGRGGNDDLQGGAGLDILSGGSGKDTISGGAGRDFLFGGSSADTFSFAATSDSGPSAAVRDMVLDFAKGTDKVDLSAIDAKDGSGTTNDTFAFLAGEGTAFTGVAGQVAFFFSGGNTIVALDTDGDKAANGQIEIAGQINLAAGDFVL